VFMHLHAEFAHLVSAKSAELCWRFLRSYSQKSDAFLKIARRRWFFHVALMIERFTIPGILRHYALRKKCLAELVRAGLSDGVDQAVVLGAGFDPLALELYDEFENVRFWEIDHPATQRYKAREVGGINPLRFHFVAADLQNSKIDAALLSDFNPAKRTIWIAEGLLMYLSGGVVKQQFEAIGRLSGPGSRFAFTFMEPQSDGRIRFRTQTKLVDWWLEYRDEPFSWATNRRQLAEFIHPWQIVRIFDDTDLRKLGSLSLHMSLAAGELICLAELS
jgi:methyltransferase (TIGR00027 family)